MRPDIEEYLREQGWVFAGVSQPDHKRQWAQMDGDKVKRVAFESELENLALEIMGSPSGLAKNEDERIRKAIEGAIRVYGKTQGEWLCGYDMDTLVVRLREAFGALEKQKREIAMTKEEVRFQVAVSCIQGILEAKLGIIGEVAPEVAVKESLRIADEFVKQWFGDSKN